MTKETTTRCCLWCGKPLVRRPRETPRTFAARRYDSRACANRAIAKQPRQKKILYSTESRLPTEGPFDSRLAQRWLTGKL